MSEKSYKVLRTLDGDRLYQPGDIRTMSELDAAPLLASGALEAIGAKVEPLAQNKTAGTSGPISAKTSRRG